MCPYLLIASDVPLANVAWDPEDPGFNVTPLPDTERQYYRHLTKRYVYRVGAWTGCACGFGYGTLPIDSDERQQEEDDARASVDALRRYITQAIEASAIEVFTCWAGEQDSELDRVLHIGLDYFGGETFDLTGNELYYISSG